MKVSGLHANAFSLRSFTEYEFCQTAVFNASDVHQMWGEVHCSPIANELTSTMQKRIQDNIKLKNSFLQKDESKFSQDRVWNCDLRLISFQHNWDRNTRGFFSATRLSSCLKSFRKIKKKKTNFFYSQSKVRSKQMQSFEKRNNCI